MTLGTSGAVTADDFFDHVTGEVVAAGARALVITGPAQPPSRHFDPVRVHVTGFVPFSAVVQRCRAAIHHAGVGTTVAVIKAGIPHLAVPWRQRHRRMRAAVRRLLDDGELRTCAAELANRLAQEDGAPASAAAIESQLRS